MNRRLLLICLLIGAFASMALPAHAAHDEVQFGSNIHVARDSSIHDAVCFFCSVEAEGTVEGDLVVFFGNIHISGHTNKDVVDFFGDVSADDDASIGKDLVSIFGSIRLGQNATVGKDLVALFGTVHAEETASVGGDRVVQPAWIFFIPLLFFGLIIFAIIRAIQHHRQRAYMRNYPMPPRP